MPGEVIVAVWDAVTVIVVGAEVAKQLLLFVTFTVYVPAAIAAYVALVAFEIIPAAFDHWYINPVPLALAESISEPPVQNEVDGDVIVGVACVVPVITVATEVALQPEAFVTSTV